jgi:hypothetical protein
MSPIEVDCAAPAVASEPHEKTSAISARRAATLSALASSVLAACGGGSSGSGPTPPPPPPAGISRAEASRFLSQASMGPTADQIARVQTVGYSAWLDEQFAQAQTTSRWDWLVGAGFSDITYRNNETGFDSSAWRKLLSSPDTLRQRVTMALSELTVAAIDGFVGAGWRAFSAAAYLDLLEANAFGNFRTLLQQISTSAPMGEYLTYRGNVKFNAKTGAMPDENYAREVMQLFSIGLLQLKLDGTPTLSGGKTPIRSTTSPAWPASSPAGTTTSPAAPRRRPTSSADR